MYSSFSKLYEQEHDYGSAIHYTKEAKKYSTPNNPYFNNRINELFEKQSKNPKKRNFKMSNEQKDFENALIDAAKYFIEHKSLTNDNLQIIRIKQAKYTKPIKSKVDIERYAIMCNAYLEHEDEMKQYKND